MKLKLHITGKKQYYSDSTEDQMLFNRVMIFIIGSEGVAKMNVYIYFYHDRVNQLYRDIFAPLIKNLS